MKMENSRFSRGGQAFLRLLAVGIALAFMAGLAPRPAAAQDGLPTGTPAPADTPVETPQSSLPPAAPGALPPRSSWSIPQRLPGYDDQASTPYLVVDQNRTVHAFNSVWAGKELLIVYSQWTRANGWTTPVDILLSPWKQQARIIGAFLDQAGIVHVAFFGGDEFQAAIFYAQAPLALAGRASAWTRVQIVGEHAITPTTGALTGDGKGRLCIIFSGNRDGVGLYATYSTDGGLTWTEPVQVALSPDEVHWPADLNVITDEKGWVHAAWTLVNIQGNGDALFYAHLDQEYKEWSDPYLLAQRDAGDYEADWGSLVSYQNQLMVVYDDSFPATRWMRRSTDGGNTWSDPVRPFNYIGEYHFAAFAVDSGNYLHMLLGNRTPDDIHGMWHSIWLGNQWSDLEPIISGPRVATGPLAGRFDPTSPSAVVVQGNVLLVVWWTDPGAGRNGVWSSYTVLNTPERPVESLPTPVPTPTATLWSGSTSLLTPVAPQAVVFKGSTTPPQAPIRTPVYVLIAASIPSILLILAVIIIFRLRLKPHH